MSLLHDLAWAGIPERVIVGKTANQIAVRGWDWERGRKGDIKEMVADTRPPRGKGASRLKSVIAELARQHKVRSKRKRNAPYKPTRYGKSYRRSRISDKLIGHSTVSDLRHSGGSVLILHCEAWNAYRVTILRPKPRIGPRQQISIRVVTMSGETVPSALFKTYGKGLVSQAQADGRQVILDFQKLETRVEKINGEYLTFPWERV